ncbi:BTB/POZ domain-containing protein 9-like [Drosophila miranda]|uniref:BTB/POZ domain-containing protein 9-like n=1 Tax=Drosophila miranda TaxID=7229 RepID=UPI0007E89CA2|nr:BTB/POZ domain-containing protein 9-like [Drosophila miranda]
MSSQEDEQTSSSPNSTKENIIDHVDSFVADMTSLCLNEPYSDVEFLVEDQRLPAHRLVLATRSEYFRAMLYGGMCESKQREVQLEVPPEAFKAILRYLYSGTLNISTLGEEGIIDVLDLAHLYGLQNVETGLVKYLQQNLDVSNVCMILDIARRSNLNQRTEDCLTFMDVNGPDIVKHETFGKLSKVSLEELLARGSFWAPEIDIFRAVCKWRDNNPSEDIKTVAALVRLPLMSVRQLLHVVRPSGMFETEQIFDAIDQVDTGNDLPHRAVVLPAENVAFGESLARRFEFSPSCEILELRNLFVINCIEFLYQRCGMVHADVSCNHTHWDRVGSTQCEAGRKFNFKKRPVRYIRFVKPHLDTVVFNVRATYSE